MAEAGPASEQSANPDCVVNVAPGVTAESTGDRVVILNGDGTAMTTLNPVGSILWERLGAAATIDDLCGVVRDRFPSVADDVARSDVGQFVDELVGLALVHLNDSPAAA